MSSSTPIPTDLLVPTAKGLYCERGGFFIDPRRPVERAITTHAHTDHAPPGCDQYVCTKRTADLIRSRYGPDQNCLTLEWGTPHQFGEVMVSLHPAGHIMGSAQVRIEALDGGPVWVVTGDCKDDDDPTTEPFESVPCDVLIIESTFGLPIYHWPEPETVLSQINDWWATNAAQERTSVVMTYAVGKAQRLLAGLDPNIGPIGIHGALVGPTEVYRAAGIKLPKTIRAGRETATELQGQGIIVCPPSAAGTPWIRRFSGKDGMETAFASGWMAVRGRQRWRGVDRGFILSDHADWDGLLNIVRNSNAKRVGVTHGSTEAFSRYLREFEGLESFVLGDQRATSDGDDG